MHRLLAFVVLALLIAHALIGDAFAGSRKGHDSTSKSGSAHSGLGHNSSSPYYARAADSGKGTYHSQLLRDKSEWRQARRRGGTPASVPPATDRQG